MKEIPTNTKNTQKPYRKEIFEAYLIWLSTQNFMGHPAAKEALQKSGLGNSDLVQLFSIKNQTGFAKAYSVENSTLTNWNKLIERKGMIKEALLPYHKLTKNVVFALYKNILDTGDANSARLWLQLMGWNYQRERSNQENEKITLAKITYPTLHHS